MNSTVRYLVVEGNIGTGKTSLSKLLAQDYGARLILEEFADNPFLPLFYQNAERYAFPVELYFMTERHKQLLELKPGPNLFEEKIVSDYIFSKTLLFAGQNLNGEEYSLFRRIFHGLNAQFPEPDLLVYIHRPVAELLQQIRLRKRDYELDMRAEYLRKIQEAYFDFFKLQSLNCPILIIDAEGLDYVHKPEDYQLIQAIISQCSYYKKGLYHIIASEWEE